MMRITINGRFKDVERDCSVEDIIALFCKETRLVVAELNGDIVKSPLWRQTRVSDGDTLELVTLVGGG